MMYAIWRKKSNIFFIYFDVVKTNHDPTCLFVGEVGDLIGEDSFPPKEGAPDFTGN